MIKVENRNGKTIGHIRPGRTAVGRELTEPQLARANKETRNISSVPCPSQGSPATWNGTPRRHKYPQGYNGMRIK